MDEKEVEEIKTLFLNRTWINAFVLVGPNWSEDLCKRIGETVLRELRDRMKECQTKDEYPYEVVFKFTAS